MKTTIANIQQSAELPVEQLYNNAIAAYTQAHAELSKLPQDKNDPLPSLDASLRELGVERDNDMSMFVMGFAGKMGLDAAFGAAANSPLTIAGDKAQGGVQVGYQLATSRQ